jgi:hypothetical protein
MKRERLRTQSESDIAISIVNDYSIVAATLHNDAQQKEKAFTESRGFDEFSLQPFLILRQLCGLALPPL